MMPFTRNGAMVEHAAERFRLLGEPMRLKILQALETGDRPVNEIVSLLHATQPNVSKHLRALCQAGLVTSRRQGLNIYYGIADPMVFKLCQLVCASAEQYARTRLAKLSAASVRRPRRKAGAQR